ncbi:sarcosine oxidase subunit alpha family protein [Roseomonas sp. CECT 9278]|uniref:sarcosine oxidase subunit alpha family protein n=1 Tax=Roseomonas sp. CECT 9278 TaxID=2845823 RepID=UPI001E2B88EC|nr:sarcosine oxidase subunit alpha family protein [Roseomonas sp. CECT 9278]CAH0264283.1 Sarcosine oxidase subunit alpha [Roseomonas sp. CECT 9278]
MTQRHRLATGGHVDRAQRLGFSFDGRRHEGHAGDTLASALLANGVRLVGRSFKYHRPRGIFSAGVEEPNALVELRSGARREPNTRATVAELFEGLAATSQNRRGSLAFDWMAVNGLLAPWLGAGFYYKTFMWPASFWERVYEPAVRKAAGLGRASGLPDPDHYEAAHAHCDVLVVGAGVAGLAAALAAGSAGARVMLLEQDFLLGGDLLNDPAQEAWRSTTIAALAAMPGVTIMPRTMAFGFYDGRVIGAVEQVADHLPEPPPHAPRQRYWTIRAQEVVLATGAHERLIAFPGNDRPGVMLAGAARTYARRYAVRAGETAVLFATHDAAYDAALALAEAGTRIAAIIDPRSDSAAMQRAREAGFTVRAGSVVTGTVGGTVLRGVEIGALGSGSRGDALPADLLMISGGWNPAVHLASMAGTPLRWDDALRAFLPGDSAWQRSAGACRGVHGIGAAAQDGAAEGRAAARAAGFAAAAAAVPLPEGPAADHRPFELWEVQARGKAFVDLQDDVTADDIRLAHREGFIHIEHAKRYTTHAMGTDQGKVGGLVGAAVLAAARGEPVATVGMPRYRPYAAPVAWGAMAGGEVGKHFQPVRRTSLHGEHDRLGAVWMDAGLWKRPAYYPKATDADAWASVKREAHAVRERVGVCDVSTLGKIAVEGPDAATFLDRVYANTFSTLAIGRARYGLMLREDGIVFDDGTTTRLGPDRFFVTTTTAQAGPVMQHLEFHLASAWPHLDVSLASVTDHWAAMSIAGPKARDVVAAVVQGIDVANEAFPFMAVADCTAAGVPARLFRISFSGELAYEIAMPAGYATHVWQAVLAAGAPHGIEPYGVEALGLLRIEKGHVAGAELNGQTTAHDLGLGRMLKKKGDFIGRVLAQRPGLTDPSRPHLVGLRSVDPNRQIRAGSHLLVDGQDQGWISSATQSVVDPGWIGLGMLRDGAARIGREIVAANPLMGEEVPVKVVTPHGYDAENLRVRA